jgi:hypothetical protein
MIEYTVKVYDNRTVWYLNDKLHRVDGPAVECDSGSKYWYLNGKLHRVDGPAVEYANGHREWYLNGKLHRVDGPAVEYDDGNRSWYLNGKHLTEKEFNQQKDSCDGTVIEVRGKKYKLMEVVE